MLIYNTLRSLTFMRILMNNDSGQMTFRAPLMTIQTQVINIIVMSISCVESFTWNITLCRNTPTRGDMNVRVIMTTPR